MVHGAEHPPEALGGPKPLPGSLGAKVPVTSQEQAPHVLLTQFQLHHGQSLDLPSAE